MEYKFIPITKEEANSRVDRVIRKQFPGLNQALIEKSLRSKLILVNQQKIASNYRLELGDHLQIAANLVSEGKLEKSKKQVTEAEKRLITDNILFQDGNLIIINKPAGLAVQGGSKIKTSIDDIMPHIMADSHTWVEKDSQVIHKLVHRLDKETSGILLIALNNHTAKELAQAFKDRLIQKKYLAILTGPVQVANGKISSFIDKNNAQSDQEDNAISYFERLANNKHASLIEFSPITGKTHQLRLHALELGYPILGDTKYDPELLDAKNVNLHLHASEIIIPYEGRHMKFKAELPAYFQASIKKLFGSKFRNN